MTKYVKFINENQIKQAPTNYTLDDGAIIFNFNTNTELMLQYGFKPLTEVERPETQRQYKITYKELTKSIKEVLTYLETEEEYQQRLTNQRKQNFENQFLQLDTNKNYRLRPAGYANAQQSMDTIKNMVEIAGSLTDEIAIKVLFYKTPDFTDETQCTEEWLVANQFSATTMSLEDFKTFYVDFTTKYMQKMYEKGLQ